MFTIDIRTDVEDVVKGLDSIAQSQVPFAVNLATNLTAKDVKDTNIWLLPSIFDRPTRYTMNSLQIYPASLRGGIAEATVFFKQSNRRRSHYLMPNVVGGSRPHSAWEYWLVKRGLMEANEYAVPAFGAPLDANGNIKGGVITSILSQLAAGPDPFQWETARSRKRAASSRTRYFVPEKGSSLKRGIWRKKGKSVIEPVFLFVASVKYEPIYRFAEISEEAVQNNFGARFAEAMIKALSTMRVKPSAIPF